MKRALLTAFGLLLTCNLLFGQAPAISTFSPATGPVGTLVTINGTNLSNPTALSIGGQSAIVVSNTGSTLAAMVMPGAVTGAVSITTAGGTASGSAFTVTATSFPVAQLGNKLVGTGDVPSAEQGSSVAVSADGNTAIVGGPTDNGDQGAVWIYVRTGGGWTQQGPKLVGTGGAVYPEQGNAVALSADGNTAMVGANDDDNNTGAVWVFVRANGVWTQQGPKLAGTANGFQAVNLGASVSLSADGNSAIVGGSGDSGTGAAWIYTRSGGTWTQGRKLVGTGSVGTDIYQGQAVAMSADGKTAIVGGYMDNSSLGAAWIYIRSDTGWIQQGPKLVGTGGVGTMVNQGRSVAISADGNTVMVGGDYDNSGLGAVWVFTRSGGVWTQQGSKLVGTGSAGNPVTQGCSVSVSADGNTALVGGCTGGGSLGQSWVYTRNGGTWAQQGSKLVGTGSVGTFVDQGISVSLSADGSTAFIGGGEDNSFDGAAWVFQFTKPLTINYTSPQTYVTGVPVTPLTPTSAWVAPAEYSDSPLIFDLGFSEPAGLAIDAAGDLYVADRANHLVKKYPAGSVNFITIGSGFNTPYGVAVDTAGNVYVADAGANNIIKVPPSGPQVVIGSGFASPWGVAVDGAGNVYVADSGNNQVKEIPGGTGTPVVLGSGFNFPTSVALDPAGNVYVTDFYNSAVKEIPVNGGSLVTVGTGFIRPAGVTVDAAGNVFVADISNHEIEEIPAGGGSPVIVGSGFDSPDGVAIDPTGKIYMSDRDNDAVKTILPIGGFYLNSFLPAGLSFNSNTGVISGVPRIKSPATNYKVTAYNSISSASATVNLAVKPLFNYNSPQTYLLGTAITPLSPTASSVAAPGYSTSTTTLGSGFNLPAGVAVDARGDVFIGDQNNNVVKEIPAGTSTPVIIATGFSTPDGVAVDAQGNVYVADNVHQAVKKIPFVSGSYGTPVVIGPDHTYFQPFDVAVDSKGNVYVADRGNGTIEEIPVNGGATFVVGSGFTSPTGVSVDAYGNVYVADNGNNTIKKIPAGGGTPVTIGSGFSGPYKAAVDGSGNVFVTDNGNKMVKEIPADGSAIRTVGSGYNLIYGVAVDVANNVFVTDYGVSAVEKVIPVGGFYINPALPPGLNFNNTTGTISGTPTAISPAANYTISGYVANGGNSVEVNIAVVVPLAAVKYTSPHTYTAGSAITPLKPTSTNIAPPAYSGIDNVLISSIVRPLGLAVDPSGNVFIGNSGFSNLTEIPAGGGAPESFGFGFNGPVDAATDAAGNVYVADYGNHVVKKLAPGVGSSPVIIGTGFSGPYGVAVDALGNVYVADRGSNTVQKIPAAGGAPVIIGSGFVNPSGIAVDGQGNVYVADSGNNAIKEIPAGGGAVVTIGSGFVNPFGVAVDPSGNLFIADTGNGRVVELPAGGTQTVIGSNFTLNTGVAIDQYGVVYMSDQMDNIVYSTKPSGGYYLSSALPAGLNFSNATGIISGTPVGGSPAKNYTITAYNAYDSASAVVNIGVAGSAALSAFKISNGVLTPTFSAATINYSANVANGLASMTVTPTAVDPSATIKVNGVTVSSGNASQSLPLAVGPNTITIAVTSGDEVTTKTYTLVVTKAPSANANLSTLGQSVGGLMPAFSSGTISYTENVSNATATITFKPVSSDANATIKVNGTAVTSGTATAPIALAAGPNTIATVVTAQDGVTTKTYTLTVTRALSTIATLSSLKLSSGTLSPAFATTTTSYSSGVANTVSTISITPATTDPNATIKVNGTAVTSGAASNPIALAEGVQTAVTILVTAQDGSTTKTYTVTVTRAPSTNANLSTLGQSVGGLTPAFSSTTTSYTENVSNAITTMTLKPVSSDANAAIKVNGTAVTSGTMTSPIALSVGANTITTIVTAQNGTTTKTYTLTVTRASGSADNYDPGISVTKPTETVLLAGDGIVVHQGVSPNGDGINDFLQIDNISQYADNKLMIMNRNGEVIYEAKGYDNSSKVFDGHSNKNGQMQLPGTYFYQLDYTVNGITKHKTGFLVLKY